MITRLEAAQARLDEADAAFNAGEYADAARDYTLAAEQLEAFWRETGGTRGQCIDAQNMRRRASMAVMIRDQQTEDETRAAKEAGR